jgi:glutathione S-transferase
LYATPGYHKEADAFNRIQRGHQAYFENLSLATVAVLFGGLQYPIASAICGALYHIGSVFYQMGYADTKLDVAVARYKKGGMVKIIGLLGSLYMSINLAGKMVGFWGSK